ncbi:MAG TPA: BatD family protein [Paludibacteraceae bacterium]|nr:BatD family protein [Paludibacteraceae bacterium]HOL00828.1 BatD family protein [Paludibacteraceae bacterium]HPO67739.1 BatD family protein [Paludibacteraceae bacterium]
MKRKILLCLVFLTGILSAKADEPVSFTASAPSTVILDKPFQLVYTINAVGKDLRIPEIKDFDILAGPFESQSSSIQIVNGKRTTSVSNSYTYTLLPKRTGTFTIPSASIMVDNQKYTSNGLTIKVLPPNKESSKSEKQESSTSPSNISEENIFIRTSVSKSTVYEQEPVLLTYKLYTLLDVVQCINKKMPDFDGFLKQEIEQAQNKQFSYENYNGRNYGTVVLYQALLYPQRPGVISIDNANFEAIIQVRNQTSIRSIFDDFFDSYTNVSKNLIAPGVKINVKPLPQNKPSLFAGAVGTFTMSSSLSANQIKENEAVTLKINIAGSGNLKLIQAPEIKFPNDFEVYDPKITNNFKTTLAGVQGTKTIEYLFIPRHHGEYIIPSAEFSYFDLRDNVYKTLRTPEYTLHVLKGSESSTTTVVSNYSNKQEIKQLGKDIRYIYTGNIKLSRTSQPLFGTLTGWLMYLITLVIAIVLFIIFFKKMKENENIVLVKNKRASKIAQKRLKTALKFLKIGKKDEFYEEILKGIWNYLSDKLNIPIASLTRETIISELNKKEIDQSLIEQLIDILNSCEFARYAPQSGQQEMGDLYSDAIKIIEQLEDCIKQ